MKQWLVKPRLQWRLLQTALLLLLVTGISYPVQADTTKDTAFKCVTSYDTNWWCKPVVHIRVKRMSLPGQPVELHDFTEWMQNSLPNEINCSDASYHQATIDATAVALRMYGWARHLARGHTSPSVDAPVTWVNYDVTDDESDGLVYREGTATTACNNALVRTGGRTVIRNYAGSGYGTIFETGWRRGSYSAVTPIMDGKDIYYQQNTEYDLDHGSGWTTYHDILSYFYDYYTFVYY